MFKKQFKKKREDMNKIDNNEIIGAPTSAFFPSLSQ